jgi:hypothetical protein
LPRVLEKAIKKDGNGDQWVEWRRKGEEIDGGKGWKQGLTEG